MSILPIRMAKVIWSSHDNNHRASAEAKNTRASIYAASEFAGWRTSIRLASCPRLETATVNAHVRGVGRNGKPTRW